MIDWENVSDIKIQMLLQKYFDPKGQLISEGLFGLINYPKNQWKIWKISALETKKWSNQQSKATFLLWLCGLFTQIREQMSGPEIS